MPRTILMRFGDTTIIGELNDTETAKAFAECLPLTIAVNGTGIDFCGRMPRSFPYEPSQVHNGWHNGDINYNPKGGWFAILFDDEEHSQRYDDQVVMGRVTDSLDVFHTLQGSYDVRIELAD